MFTDWNEEEISNLYRTPCDGAKTIRISAGKRGLQLEIAPQDLQQLTQATVFENHPDEVEA